MVKLIAIVEKNFGLTKNGEIPWEFSEDRVLFRELTENSVVIMGKNTFLSHKNFPLKNRVNCVITRERENEPSRFANNAERENSSVICFTSLEEAIANYPDAWIIGGARLYNYALQHELVDVAIITHIQREYEADKFLNPEYLKKFKRELLVKKDAFCIWRLTRHRSTKRE